MTKKKIKPIDPIIQNLAERLHRLTANAVGKLWDPSFIPNSILKQIPNEYFKQQLVY